MLNETEFLQRYDASVYPRLSVAVDAAAMTVADGVPAVLLVRRTEHPHLGRWSLPGGFVGPAEGLDDAARRVLAGKGGMGGEGAFLEQLYTFGAPDRDPRTRIVSVAYLALLPHERLRAAVDPDAVLARLSVPSGTGPAEALGPDGEPLPLAFDHADVLALAVRRLRGRLDYTPVAFPLLPDRFTLRQLQDVHEAVLGRTLNKPAFRRRMLDRGWLEATGERAGGTSFRPPELFRYRPPQED